MQIFQFHPYYRCKFYLDVNEKAYKKYSKLIQEHGGEVVPFPRKDVFTFTSDNNRYCTEEKYKLSYITDCIRKNKLLNISDYLWYPARNSYGCGMSIFLYEDPNCNCFSCLRDNLNKNDDNESSNINDLPQIRKTHSPQADCHLKNVKKKNKEKFDKSIEVIEINNSAEQHEKPDVRESESETTREREEVVEQLRNQESEERMHETIEMKKQRLNIKEVKIVCEMLDLSQLTNSLEKKKKNQTLNEEKTNLNFATEKDNTNFGSMEGSENCERVEENNYQEKLNESFDGLKENQNPEKLEEHQNDSKPMKRKIKPTIDSDEEYFSSQKFKRRKVPSNLHEDLDDELRHIKQNYQNILTERKTQPSSFSEDSCLQGRSTLNHSQGPSVFTQMPAPESHEEINTQNDCTNLDRLQDRSSDKEPFDSLDVFPSSTQSQILSENSTKSQEEDECLIPVTGCSNLENQESSKNHKVSQSGLKSNEESEENELENNINTDDLLDRDDREALLNEDSETEFENTIEPVELEENNDSDVEIIAKVEPMEGSDVLQNNQNNNGEIIEIIKKVQNCFENEESRIAKEKSKRDVEKFIFSIEKESQHFSLEINATNPENPQGIDETDSDCLSEAETIPFVNQETIVKEDEILDTDNLITRRETEVDQERLTLSWNEFISSEDNGDVDKEKPIILEKKRTITEIPEKSYWDGWDSLIDLSE